MGEWARGLFGQESFGDIGFVFAGTIKEKLRDEFFGCFESVEESRSGPYEGYLGRIGERTIPIVSNVYGAPAMVDALTEMHDGGCRNVIFIGSAYGGFKNLPVASTVLPEKSYHYDGVYHSTEPREYNVPDQELFEKLKEAMDSAGLEYHVGVNISVPAVTLQPKHDNDAYKRIQPTTVEMELAACFSRGEEIGVRCVGILVISDNRTTSIADREAKKKKNPAKIAALEAVLQNLDSFSLPALPVEFSIAEHLGDIIHDPDDKNNVYKN